MKKRTLAGYFISLIAVILLLSVNDFRYGSSLPGFWIYVFNLCLFLGWLFFEKRKKILLAIVSAITVILLMCYVIALPQFTYKEAVSQLQSYYREENFSASLNTEIQSFAAKITDGKIKYYRYVVESGDKYYLFDQYTGEYGQVTTGTKSQK